MKTARFSVASSILGLLLLAPFPLLVPQNVLGQELAPDGGGHSQNNLVCECDRVEQSQADYEIVHSQEGHDEGTPCACHCIAVTIQESKPAHLSETAGAGSGKKRRLHIEPFDWPSHWP